MDGGGSHFLKTGLEVFSKCSGVVHCSSLPVCWKEDPDSGQAMQILLRLLTSEPALYPCKDSAKVHGNLYPTMYGHALASKRLMTMYPSVSSGI